MMYTDRTGRSWPVKITLRVAVDVCENWGLNILQPPRQLTSTDAARILYAAADYDAGILDNADADAMLTAATCALMAFYFPPDYTADKSKKVDASDEKLTFVKVFEIAGAAGVNPMGLALWQIAALARGAQKRDWATTSASLAMAHNAACGKRSKMKTPDDFNPTIDKKKAAADAPSIDSVLFKSRHIR